MTENNRTERRLLDSIRKAKTGSEDESAPSASSSKRPATGMATAEQPAVRKTTAAANGAATAGTAKAMASTHDVKRPTSAKRAHPKASADAESSSYQSGRRVWPD